MVKPPDVFPKYRIQEVWKGARQVHQNGGAASGECVVGVGCCTLVARASGCTYMAEPLPCAMV